MGRRGSVCHLQKDEVLDDGKMSTVEVEDHLSIPTVRSDIQHRVLTRDYIWTNAVIGHMIVTEQQNIVASFPTDDAERRTTVAIDTFHDAGYLVIVGFQRLIFKHDSIRISGCSSTAMGPLR